MNYWWVNHKQTYKEEIEGGYIWSPTKEKNGSRNQTYINLTEARVNDTIFSYADGEIKAIGIVKSEYQDRDRPVAFGKAGNQWAKTGWLVRIGWSVLDTPFSPKAHISIISPLLPEKNSPLQANGNGNQKCYLAKISDALGERMLEIAQSKNEEVSEDLADLSMSIADDNEETRIVNDKIPESEKEQLIKARRGQGIFRMRVEKIESACRLTGIRDKRLLIASHIKPWRKSDNAEKLDGNNGLLLSPHVDKLFDKGWISLSNEGDILCTNDGIKKVMVQWGLDPNKNVGEFKENQKKYLAYHRENIYQG